MVPSDGSQSEVFRLLGDPSTHGGCPVRRIDTHAAAVFLAGERAYKVKRAVRFPFLDYSSLEKRHAACLAELDVNRSFAPQLYRRVVAITREPNGRLALGGKGAPVEWAVEMRRFDEDQTLDHLASTGMITGALAERLALMVAAMHGRAPSFDANTWFAAMAAFLDQNAAAFRSAPELFPQDQAVRLERSSRAAFERLQPLLRARGERGFVRRGHGDLHLGNIVLLDGEPVPFDAIEFDPVIAAGDVLYDLAFLLMDLIERGLDPAANVVLNGYLVETRDADHLDGLAALPLFMSLRAAIRAKVTAARLPLAAGAERRTIADTAKTYFALALRLITPPPPVLVAVGGLSGTGKSSVARAIAPFVLPSPGAVVIRSDVERKLLFGVAPNRPLPPQAYRADVSARVYEILVEKAARVLAAGHSAVTDAVYAKVEERAAIAAVAAARQIPFHGLFLVADLKTRLERIGARSGDASDADARVARQQEDYALGRLDWQPIDARGAIDATVSKARAALTR